ncbi:hypothetical protein GCM10022235_55520 [Kribbella ginsengisoli]|uniref:Basic secretory peptidase family protein n=1 Tax=Kribbella ginsengisoli TaxID=363865 RepID=A0ABP6Y8T5_9ACTN
MVVLAGGVTGGALWRARGGEKPAPVTSTAAQVDVVTQRAAVDAILKRRASAVLRKDRAQFLADVDPANKKLVAEQKVLFGNLVQFGFTKLSYLRGEPQVKQWVVDEYGPTSYVVRVAMAYQIGGIDDQPVKAALGYSFAQCGGRYLLVNDTDLDGGLPNGSHKEAWDLGPVLVRRGKRALVVVEPGNTKLAASILSDAEAAVKVVNKTWSAGWRGGGLVIALTINDQQVRNVDFSNPQQESIAQASHVYRTLPTEADKRGMDGGAYVLVNPTDRYDLDTRILAHEFTHVACAAYGNHAPTWLVEGAARYVDWQTVLDERGLDRHRTEVRSDYLGKANTLPSDEYFFRNPGSSYEIGWLTVDYLVRKYGEGKVVGLYRELALRGTDQNQRDRIMVARLGRNEQQVFADLKRG